MEKLPVTQVLSLFETNKNERKGFVDEVVAKLDSGTVNPLTLHLHIKCAEEIIKNILNDSRYREHTLSEAQKNGKEFTYHHSKFQVKETGTKYDFTKCEDPILGALTTQLESLEAQVKQRQAFLKNVPLNGQDILVEDEVIRVFPPTKTSTTSIAVTLI